MKYTETELDHLLDKLICSTRSPRGRFSSAVGYPRLEKQLKSPVLRSFSMRILSGVAATVLLCLFAWATYLYMQPITLQTVTTLAETRIVKLPDGTSAILNSYSSLSYPEKFNADTREVKLSGEAYFEVSKDKKHPFIVQTADIDVQVLGTHFNVNAYRNNPEVITTLLTGSVAVSSRTSSTRIVLQPNEMAIYNKVKGQITRKTITTATDEIAWCHGEFIFDHTPLQEIVRKLSNSFGVTIQIADTTLQNYHITARFRNGESIEDILSALCSAGYFNYSQNNKQITIIPKPDLK